MFDIAYAQGMGGAAGGPSPMVTLIPFALIFVIMYFMVIRPQQKKAREHDTLMKGLRAGDKVVTTSGILGVVLSIKDRSVSIRSADTKLEVLKSAIAEVTERGETAAGS